MRLLRFLVTYVIVTVLGITLLLFVALNHFTVQLDVFGPEYSVSVALIMAGAAVFGFVAAMLLVLPGRIASALNARSLNREVRYLEQDIAELQDLRARLLARHDYLIEGHERILLRYHSLLSDHSRVVSERDEAREQLASVRAARPIAAAAGQSSAAPLRLLSPVPPAPAVARPAEQPPAARISAQVAADVPRVTQREARSEPPRAMSAALLPAPVGVTSDPPRSVPVTSITEVEARNPASPAIVPTTVAPAASPAISPASVAPSAAPEPRVAPPVPPQRKAEPRKPLLQPALLLQRAQRSLATQRDRAQRGLTTQRNRIQRSTTQLRDQLRPRLAALRATVETQLSQLRQRLTSPGEEQVASGEEPSQTPVARVASVSHPLGD